MILAKLNQQGVVIDAIVNDIVLPGYVECPEHIGIGMSIDTPIPPPPPPTKAEKLAAINAARDKALSAGFTHAGHSYHCDAIFQSQLQAFVLAWQQGILAPTATVAIRRKDNTTSQMGQADVLSLTWALMAHVQGIYVASWAEKDAL